MTGRSINGWACMGQHRNGELVACIEKMGEEGRARDMHGANRQARMEPVACMEQIGEERESLQHARREPAACMEQIGEQGESGCGMQIGMRGESLWHAWSK